MRTERPTCRECACTKVCEYFQNENERNLDEKCPLEHWENYFVPKREWISVDDRLPTENGKYWCAYIDPRGANKVCIFEFCAVYNAAWDVNSNNVGKFTVFDGDCFIPVRNSITHWMPYEIPEPPRKEDEGNEN